MPSWIGGNTKGVEARARRSAIREEEKEKEQKRKEDQKWKDEISEAKLSKKEELAVKQQEKTQRKAELRALAEQEAAKFETNKKTKPTSDKLTRAQIQQKALLAAAMKKKQEDEVEESTSTVDVFEIENPNRLRAEEIRLALEKGQECVSASSVGEFFDQLDSEQLDRFPTKRMRAAYTAYEEEWMKILKHENPTLKRSQMKERIWKQWQKASENPLNQVQQQ